MSNPTTVNPQITDSVNPGDTQTPLGDAPAMAMGSLYQAAAASAGLAMQNAVYAQNAANAMQQATVTQGVNLLLTSPTGRLPTGGADHEHPA